MSLGKDITFIIDCSYNFMSDWQSFAAWNSIRINMPYANVSLVVRRRYNKTLIFNWVYKIKVGFFMTSSKKPAEIIAKENLILDTDIYYVIPSHVIAINEFDQNIPLITEAYLGENSVFVSYKERCGEFNYINWIHTYGQLPFKNAQKRFGKNGVNLNESKILDIWEYSLDLYKNLVAL